MLKHIFLQAEWLLINFTTRYKFNMFHFQSRLHGESGICTVLSLTGLWFPQLLICQLSFPSTVLLSPALEKLHTLPPPLYAPAFCQPVFPVRKTNPTHIHACRACQMTDVLNSHPLPPPRALMSVFVHFDGDLVSAAHLDVWFSEGRSLKLQTLPVSDAVINPA